MSSRLKSGEGLGVFFSTGILIRFCHKCNLFHLHCQAKEAELPESGNDPKDDKNR